MKKIDLLFEGFLEISFDKKIIAINNAAKEIFNNNNLNLKNIPLVEVTRSPEIHEILDDAIRQKSFYFKEEQIELSLEKKVRLRIVKDISEEKLSIALQDLNQDEEKTKKWIDYLQMVSHEIKTPLSIVAANLELMMQMEKNLQKPHLLKRARKNALFAQNIIGKILDLAKMDHVRPALNIEPIDLKLFFNKWEQNKILNFEQIGHIVILADKELLEQILLNIFENAYKYASKSQITVEAYPLNDMAHIFIKDKGPGIDEKHLSKVFNMFFKEENNSSGYGVGLALIKQQLKFMNGKIEAKNYKEGLLLSLYLPLSR